MKDAEFADTDAALIEDHQISLDHFRIMIAAEQHITSDLEDEIQDLITIRNSNLKKLAAAEASKAALSEDNEKLNVRTRASSLWLTIDSSG
jgi:hypothetical protein